MTKEMKLALAAMLFTGTLTAQTPQTNGQNDAPAVASTATDTTSGTATTPTTPATATTTASGTGSAGAVQPPPTDDGPGAIKYKGITFKPGGFVAFEGVFRNRSVNSDINTPFNSIPFPSANEGHVSELNFTGRQSRLSLLVEAPAGNVKLTGYYEMDWLGTGTSSNNNQSNSYVLRQRQIWGQAAMTSGFSVTGGQMWSLVTEDRTGADARSEIQPQTIDSQYLVGYSWERQPGIRVQQRFGDYKTGAFTVAVAAEQAQITNFTVSSSLSSSIPTQYFFAGTGQNGGLYNSAGAVAAGNAASTAAITTYANNVLPDFVVKFAYDNPTFHAELGGLARFLRDYYFPVTIAGTATAPVLTYVTAPYLHHTADAGGVFGTVRGYIGTQNPNIPGTSTKFPSVEIAVQGMAGTGTGRYGSSQLADATLRPDETLEPIRNYHGLFSLETHLNPKFDVFAYYGGEFAERTVYMTGSGNYMGYGPENLSNAGCYNLPVSGGTAGTGGNISASGTCQSPTKYIEEGMFGFQWKPISSPRFGKLQYSLTYSLIQRQLWAGIGSASTPVSPRAQDSIVHIQMRYYIP